MREETRDMVAALMSLYSVSQPMRIQRFISLLLVMATMMLSATYLSGMYYEFRKNENRRIHDLSNNVYLAISNSLKRVAESVNASIDWSDDSHGPLSEEVILSDLRHLHVEKSYRLDEENAFLWKISDDRDIVKMVFDVGERKFQVSYVMLADSLFPMLRVEPMFDNAHNIRALYFSSRAIMDFNLVNNVSVIAYNLESRLFGGIYPTSLYGNARTSLIRQVDVVVENLTKDIPQGDVMEIGDYKFMAIPLTTEAGLIVGSAIEPWSNFAWLPDKKMWWSAILLSILLPAFMVMLFVTKYVSLPFKVATEAMKYGKYSGEFPQAAIYNSFMPGESRTLLKEARGMVAKQEKERDDEAPRPTFKLMSENSFVSRVQQAMMSIGVKNRYAMLVAMEEKCQGGCRPVSDGYLHSQEEGLTNIINSFSLKHTGSLLGISSTLVALCPRYGLWVWVESDAKEDIVAEQLASHIKNNVRRVKMDDFEHHIHVIDSTQGFGSSQDLMKLLSFSQRKHQWHVSKGNVSLLSIKDLHAWRQDKHMTGLAMRGFTSDDIALRMTPIIRNGTGEVTYLRVSPFVICDEAEDILVSPGEWLSLDYQATLAQRVCNKAACLLRNLEKWGFIHVKVAVPVEVSWLLNDHLLAEIETIDNNLSSRLVLEVSGSVSSQKKYHAVKSVRGKGFCLALLHDLNSSHLGFQDDIEYMLVNAASYQATPSLFHKVQASVRHQGRLVSNLESAAPLMRTASFCLPDDYSLVTSHAYLSLPDALKFMQRDISLNVLSSACHQETVSDSSNSEKESIEEGSNVVMFNNKFK